MTILEIHPFLRSDRLSKNIILDVWLVGGELDVLVLGVSRIEDTEFKVEDLPLIIRLNRNRVFQDFCVLEVLLDSLFLVEGERVSSLIYSNLRVDGMLFDVEGLRSSLGGNSQVKNSVDTALELDKGLPLIIKKNILVLEEGELGHHGIG